MYEKGVKLLKIGNNKRFVQESKGEIKHHTTP